LFSCNECIQLLREKLAKMKETMNHNFEEVKQKIKKDLKDIYVKLNIDDFDFQKYYEEVNEKVKSFKEEILEKVNYLLK
jgi:hypothetical protein